MLYCPARTSPPPNLSFFPHGTSFCTSLRQTQASLVTSLLFFAHPVAHYYCLILFISHSAVEWRVRDEDRFVVSRPGGSRRYGARHRGRLPRGVVRSSISSGIFQLGQPCQLCPSISSSILELGCSGQLCSSISSRVFQLGRTRQLRGRRLLLCRILLCRTERASHCHQHQDLDEVRLPLRKCNPHSWRGLHDFDNDGMDFDLL